jgi:hypothetical protein
MGIGRHVSAISAGALALTLGGGTPLLAAGPARAADCDSHGPLSGVTNSLCQVVDGVTDVVDEVTGGTLSTVTDTVDSTVSGVTNSTGGTGSTGPTSTPSGGPPEDSPSAPVSTGGVGGTVRAACLPLLAGPECDEKRSAEPRPRASRSPRPRPAESDSDSDSGGGTLPTDYPRPPENRPQFLDDGDGDPVPPGEPDGDGMVVKIEDAEVPLLWPGQFVPALTGDARGGSARPRQPYDPVGTGLTAVLLLSAVLATRVVASRRAREEEEPDGLPLSGLPMTTGRHHRLA